MNAARYGRRRVRRKRTMEFRAKCEERALIRAARRRYIKAAVVLALAALPFALALGALR